jgi:hypothetical protein
MMRFVASKVMQLQSKCGPMSVILFPHPLLLFAISPAAK